MPAFHESMWFDEFEPGQQLVTEERTVEETDLVDFAELTGDFNPIHLDQDFAKESIFGKRVAHGLLVMSMAIGLIIKTGVLDGTIDAFRSIKTWKFKKPVYIGDAIRAKLAVKTINSLRGLDSGIVQLGINVINQDEALVMSGELSVLIRSKPV